MTIRQILYRRDRLGWSFARLGRETGRGGRTMKNLYLKAKASGLRWNSSTN